MVNVKELARKSAELRKKKAARRARSKKIIAERKRISAGKTKPTSQKSKPSIKKTPRKKSITTLTRTVPKTYSVSEQSRIESPRKAVELDLLTILKLWLKRKKKNNEMVVTMTSKAPTIISYGRIDPAAPPEEDVVVKQTPYAKWGDYVGGGGVGYIPPKPTDPIVTPIQRGRYYYKRKPLSATRKSKLSGTSRVTLINYLGSKVTVRRTPKRALGYYVIVRIKNNDVRVKYPPLTFTDAKDLLAFKLDNNSFIIGKVVSAGPTNIFGVLPRKVKGYFSRNKRKFKFLYMKNGEKKMINNVLIEKKKYRRDTAGEKKQIRKVIKRKKPIKRKRKK